MASAKGDHPTITAATARLMLENSTSWPSPPPAGQLLLGRISVTAGAHHLVQPWTHRLAWYLVQNTPVRDLSTCPRGPATPQTPPPGPQHHLYAVDASGVGDGLIYVGPGISCGSRTPTIAVPLARLWSAPWRISSTSPQRVVLTYTPPPCGTRAGEQAVSTDPYEWAELFAVPYGATQCPAPSGRRTVDVITDAGPGRAVPVPTVRPPLFGWVDRADGELAPPLT